MIRDTDPMSCLFCDIVTAPEHSSVVYEDDTILAFCDIYPVNPGHVLVIPKAHAVGLADLDVTDGQRMFRVAQDIAGSIRQSDLRCEGINLFLADGAAALQEIFHVHLHVFPRYEGDRFQLESGQSSTATAKSDLDEVARKVRAALQP